MDHVTQNLVRVALGVCEMNSAGRHFETAIANHIATGSDLGDIGHSRKLFPDILKTCEIWCQINAIGFG